MLNVSSQKILRWSFVEKFYFNKTQTGFSFKTLKRACWGHRAKTCKITFQAEFETMQAGFFKG